MTLKVFDLQCEHAHVFEGWFSSLDNFQSQQDRGLLTCPVCGSSSVVKKLSAPRINVGRGQPVTGRALDERAASPQAGADSVAALDAQKLAALQANVMRYMRDMVRNAENVGVRFSEEARRMHEGDSEQRAIRGTATAQEQEELVRDGISITPIPDFLDDERLQ
jgi:hypothetical protein